jgi:hypothetical protein
MEKSKLKEYSFESPLLVTDQELVALPAETWQSGEDWIKALQERTDVLGIVLPLEIKANPHQSGQDLHGVELLNWLRWSAEESLRYLPVLAVAWQPIETVLSRTLNLLLVTRGTTFIRLPEAGVVLPNFVDDLRKNGQNSHKWLSTRPEDLERIAGGTKAEQISYHDLANEFYAADRLWEGYKHAVRQAKLETEINRVEGVSLSFTESLNRKLARPATKEYLASRHRQANPVYYPITDKAEDLLKAHVTNGLPNDVRVLIVDDEFEKGLAEVLLQMLFKDSKFTYKLPDEWVYTKENKARLVCVKSICEAAMWLKHWDEADVHETLGIDSQAIDNWVEKWANYFGRYLEWKPEDGLQAATRDLFDFVSVENNAVDKFSQGGLKPTTVLLLDLHLLRQETAALYEPNQMASVRLWRAIKDENDSLPIIIFTASRQTMNYSAIMNVAGASDGWLTKEGPDITLNDEQSSRASLYLLERLHMFSGLRDWYRSEINWDIPWREEYSEAYQSSQWAECLNHIASESTRIFRSIQDASPGPFQDCFNLTQNVEIHFEPLHFPIERKMVSRQIAVAALLSTAERRPNGKPKWDIVACQKLLNCLPAQAYGKLEQSGNLFNFSHVLWFRSNIPTRVLSSLLKEEYQWLKQTFPAAEYPQIHAYLEQAET